MWIGAELIFSFLVRLLINLRKILIKKLLVLLLIDTQPLLSVIHTFHKWCKDNKFISFYTDNLCKTYLKCR